MSARVQTGRESMKVAKSQETQVVIFISFCQITI